MFSNEGISVGSGMKCSQFLKNSSSVKLNAVLTLSMQQLSCDLNTLLRSTLLLPWKTKDMGRYTVW